MTHAMPPIDAAQEDARNNRAVQDDLRLLAEEARALAEAEIAFQKSRAAYAGSEARNIALLGVAAAAFLFFAVMALVFGLVLSLAPLLTPWGAMAVVTLALLLIAALCVTSASRRWKRMLGIISAGEPK